MTLQNRGRNRPSTRLPKSSRPRLPRGPNSYDRGPAFSTRPTRDRADRPLSGSAAPPETRQGEAGRGHAPEENPLNGSPGGSSRPTRESRIASTQPFEREKTRTLTVKEAAYRLKKSVDAVYKWLRQGRLRGWQLGGRGCSVMVSEESVEEVLAGSCRPMGAGHSA